MSEKNESTNYDELRDGVKIGATVEIRLVDIDSLREQDLNPNVMPDQMFDQLTSNIQTRGELVESLPYVWDNGETIEIISGHHRVRAAREADVEEIPCLVETGELDEDDVIAKQLAHNSISGEMDDQLVFRLWDSIDDVDRRLEAYIDPDDLELPPEAYAIDRTEVEIETHTLNLVFLPRQLEEYDDVLEALSYEVERVDIANVEDWEAFSDAVNRVKEVDDIRSVGTAIARMAEVIQEHYLEGRDAGEIPGPAGSD